MLFLVTDSVSAPTLLAATGPARPQIVAVPGPVSLTLGEAMAPIDMSLAFSGGARPVYSAIGLPEGLSIDSDGVIAGAPTVQQPPTPARVIKTDVRGWSAAIEILFDVARAVVAPDAFGADDWAVADAGAPDGDRVLLSVARLPFDGGAPIRAIAWRADSGAGYGASQALGLAGPGAVSVQVLSTTPAAIQLRAMSDAGEAPWSASKTVMPTAPVPALFASDAVQGDVLTSAAEDMRAAAWLRPGLTTEPFEWPGAQAQTLICDAHYDRLSTSSLTTLEAGRTYVISAILRAGLGGTARLVASNAVGDRFLRAAFDLVGGAAPAIDHRQSAGLAPLPAEFSNPLLESLPAGFHRVSVRFTPSIVSPDVDPAGWRFGVGAQSDDAPASTTVFRFGAALAVEAVQKASPAIGRLWFGGPRTIVLDTFDSETDPMRGSLDAYVASDESDPEKRVLYDYVSGQRSAKPTRSFSFGKRRPLHEIDVFAAQAVLPSRVAHDAPLPSTRNRSDQTQDVADWSGRVLVAGQQATVSEVYRHSFIGNRINTRRTGYNDAATAEFQQNEQFDFRHRITLRLASEIPAGALVAVQPPWSAASYAGGVYSDAAPSDAVMVAQTGYGVKQPKRALVSMWFGARDNAGSFATLTTEDTITGTPTFRVVDATTGAKVFPSATAYADCTAEAVGASSIDFESLAHSSGSRIWHADFDALETPGSYRVEVPGVGSSPVFEIKASAHRELAAIIANSMTYHRRRQDMDFPGSLWGAGVVRERHTYPHIRVGAMVSQTSEGPGSGIEKFEALCNSAIKIADIGRGLSTTVTLSSDPPRWGTAGTIVRIADVPTPAAINGDYKITPTANPREFTITTLADADVDSTAWSAYSLSASSPGHMKPVYPENCVTAIAKDATSGLWRVTLAHAQTWTTGNSLCLYNLRGAAGGADELMGKTWTITRISDTVFELQGSGAVTLATPYATTVGADYGLNSANGAGAGNANFQCRAGLWITPNFGWQDMADADTRPQHLEVARMMVLLATIFPNFRTLDFPTPEGAGRFTRTLNRLGVSGTSTYPAGMPKLMQEAAWCIDHWRDMQAIPVGGLAATRGGAEINRYQFNGGTHYAVGDDIAGFVYGADAYTNYSYAASAALMAWALRHLYPSGDEAAVAATLADEYEASAVAAYAWAEANKDQFAREGNEADSRIKQAVYSARANLWIATGVEDYADAFALRVAADGTDAVGGYPYYGAGDSRPNDIGDGAMAYLWAHYSGLRTAPAKHVDGPASPAWTSVGNFRSRAMAAVTELFNGSDPDNTKLSAFMGMLKPVGVTGRFDTTIAQPWLTADALSQVAAIWDAYDTADQAAMLPIIKAVAGRDMLFATGANPAGHPTITGVGAKPPVLGNDHWTGAGAPPGSPMFGPATKKIIEIGYSGNYWRGAERRGYPASLYNDVPFGHNWAPGSAYSTQGEWTPHTAHKIHLAALAVMDWLEGVAA